jgi:hypothetical protein
MQARRLPPMVTRQVRLPITAVHRQKQYKKHRVTPSLHGGRGSVVGFPPRGFVYIFIFNNNSYINRHLAINQLATCPIDYKVERAFSIIDACVHDAMHLAIMAPCMTRHPMHLAIMAFD